MQLDAPKECGGVDQVCDFSRTGDANPAVIQGERSFRIPERKMEQSQMPPAVRGDHRIRLPLVPVLDQPAHSGLGPIGHFENVRHHVVRARVLAIEGERRKRRPLRALKISRLLETEGMHREHGGIAGKVARPGRQHRSDTLVQAFDIPSKVIE